MSKSLRLRVFDKSVLQAYPFLNLIKYLFSKQNSNLEHLVKRLWFLKQYEVGSEQLKTVQVIDNKY